MLSVSGVNIFSFNFGPSVTGIGQIGSKGGMVSPESAVKLTVPWRPIQENPSLFSFLSWHTAISEFAGREEKMEALEAWAMSEPSISVKFLTGEGGVGKSRLGAEFAEHLNRRQWSAGFVDLRRPQAFPMEKEGTLLVVDYPEEHREAVGELLKDLAGLGGIGRFRLLFLTRRKISDWEEFIHDNRAVDLVDMSPVDLGRLDDEAGYKLYSSALEQSSEKLKTVPLPLSQDALSHWLRQAPENDRAIFIVAAAVHSAMHPEEEVVKYSGPEVIKTLVARERDRVRGIARGSGAEDPDVFSRVLAMAAIADKISVESIREFAEKKILNLEFPKGTDIERELKAAGLLSEGVAQAPKPDIVGALFAVEILSLKPEHAPDMVWAALSLDIEGGLERLGRLCHDSEIVLAIHEHRIRTWLAEAVEERPSRCARLEEFFAVDKMPLGWNDAAIAVWRTLLDGSVEDEKKAWLLNNLSVHLSYAGDNAGAIKTIREAVEIRRRLSDADPARFEPGLARSLYFLGKVLSGMEQYSKAVKAFKEGIERVSPFAKKWQQSPFSKMLDALEIDLAHIK